MRTLFLDLIDGLALNFKPFAWLMDHPVYRVALAFSPNLRAHRRAVQYQDDHLYHGGHNPPVDECGWCQEAAKKAT